MATNNNSYQNALQTAQFYNYNNDLKKARIWFNVAMDCEDTRSKALFRLIKLEIVAKNFVNARTILNNNSDISDFNKNYLLYRINECEYNFETSKNNLEKAMNVTCNPNLLLNMAALYKETGDYSIASIIIESLLKMNPNDFSSIMEMVHLDMMKHEFYRAFDRFKTLGNINYKFKDNEKIEYYTLEMYLKYFLGQLHTSDNIFNGNNSYRKYRLFNQSDEVLLEHIAKHFKKDDMFDSYFLKYLDIKKVLFEVKERIEAMNSITRDICCDTYNIRLDNPIGFCNNEITFDLQVSTIPGTSTIITMYPIRLSDEYDKEGLATSKTLMKKRILGGKYDK